MAGTAAAVAFSWELATTSLVECTSPKARWATARERSVEDFPIGTFRSPTFVFEPAPTTKAEHVTNPASERLEEALVAEIREYSELHEGWDGEGAAPPAQASIEAAINFVRLLGADALRLEPTLHADGTVILETPEGLSFRFISASEISAVLPDSASIVQFDGSSVPLPLALVM